MIAALDNAEDIKIEVRETEITAGGGAATSAPTRTSTGSLTGQPADWADADFWADPKEKIAMIIDNIRRNSDKSGPYYLLNEGIINSDGAKRKVHPFRPKDSPIPKSI